MGMTKKRPRSKKIDGVGAVGLVKPIVRIEAALRVSFSLQHLLAASQFSSQVAKLEQAHKGEEFGAFFEEILWFSSACVLLCSAGLEAYVNELFVDRSQNFPDLRPEVADKLWELLEQEPILEKFEMALLLKQKPSLERGLRPTQDIAALVALRNGLTHFKPEWSDKQVVHSRLSKQLEVRGFGSSPFLPSTESIFPRRWATHGCTQWAVRSCVNFLTCFESLSEVPAKMKKFSARLAG